LLVRVSCGVTIAVSAQLGTIRIRESLTPAFNNLPRILSASTTFMDARRNVKLRARVNRRTTHVGMIPGVRTEATSGNRSCSQLMSPAPRQDARPGVHTHQLILALLGAANRRTVLAELAGATIGTGPYATSTEELAPVRHDARAALATATLASARPLKPAWRTYLTGGAVDAYALGAHGWHQILDAAIH